jgi:hypothetical protein
VNPYNACHFERTESVCSADGLTQSRNLLLKRLTAADFRLHSVLGEAEDSCRSIRPPPLRGLGFINPVLMRVVETSDLLVQESILCVPTDSLQS